MASYNGIACNFLTNYRKRRVCLVSIYMFFRPKSSFFMLKIEYVGSVGTFYFTNTKIVYK
jgi:hypothetical protein